MNATLFLWKGCQLQKRLETYALKQGSPTFLWTCTPSAFRQTCTYP